MKYIYYLLICAVLCSCKDDFLDAKPSSDIVVPNTLDDCQRLLENNQLNTTAALAVLSADEYEFNSYEDWLSTNTATERNAFIWTRDLFEGEVERKDWNAPYVSVFYANSVLSALESIDHTDRDRHDYMKGWALMVRSFAFFDLVRNFATAYDKLSAEDDPGIPLRLKPEVDEILERATVQQTYDQIITDLERAAALLPEGIPVRNRNRPSKEAVFGLLSRVYLNMREYDKALLYADSCLSLYDKLIDYNTVDIAIGTPFLRDNDEVIFQGTQHNAYAVTAMNPVNQSIRVNSDLLELYIEGDLRKQLYFESRDGKKYHFKRGYNQALYPFSGIAVDEVMLIHAECLARVGREGEAMQNMNRLLEKRFRSGAFVPVTIDKPNEVLEFILQERRKELVWRGHRWFDLIRLNKEGRGISLHRQLGGKEYELHPDDSRWVFPIPDDEIGLSGIVQNIR